MLFVCTIQKNEPKKQFSKNQCENVRLVLTNWKSSLCLKYFVQMCVTALFPLSLQVLQPAVCIPFLHSFILVQTGVLFSQCIQS